MDKTWVMHITFSCIINGYNKQLTNGQMKYISGDDTPDLSFYHYSNSICQILYNLAKMYDFLKSFAGAPKDHIIRVKTNI